MPLADTVEMSYLCAGGEGWVSQGTIGLYAGGVSCGQGKSLCAGGVTVKEQ